MDVYRLFIPLSLVYTVCTYSEYFENVVNDPCKLKLFILWRAVLSLAIIIDRS